MMNGKCVYFKVGRRVINQYEIRDVYNHPRSVGRPLKATVTYKDGSQVDITGPEVICFNAWLLDKPIPRISDIKDWLD